MSKLSEIYNFAQINENLATAGQATREQLPSIKEAGYEVIINIANGTTEHDIPEEADIVAQLGMTYHNIPVDWENPKDSDLQEFFSLMDANQDKKIFVHCIANYRVSAFLMLYRVIKQDVSLEDAQKTKEMIWKPDHIIPIWDTFIENALKTHKSEE